MATTQWIGIDVGQETLKIARPEGAGWKIETVPNTLRGIVGWIKSLGGGGGAQVLLEATGTYSSKLAHALHRCGVPFSVVTPRQSSQFSGVLKNITKNDERDACSLSLFGRHMRPGACQAPSERVERLKQLRAVPGQLKKQRHALRNQRHALQQHARPAQMALDVIEQTLGRLGSQIETLENEVCALSGEAFAALSAKITTVKGIGPKTATALLVATDGLKGFTDVKQLAKFVGLAPAQRQSGTSLHPHAHIARAADPELRTLFYMATWSACKSNRACIELRKKLKNKGKPPKVVLVAVAHKLLRQVWGVVKNDAPFDNDHEAKRLAE